MSNFIYVNCDLGTMVIEEITVKKCTCERCGHDWVTRGIEMPKVCPRCKSPYWNTPKKK